METIRQYRSIIVWSTIGIIILGTFWYAFVLSQRAGKTPLTLVVVPQHAKVTMNDTKVASGTHYLLPGRYTIIAQAEGFLNYRKDIQLGPDSVDLPVALVPISQEAKEWVKKNQQLYQGIVDKSRSQEAQVTALIRQKNPIVDRLPFENMLFSIAYRADPSDDTHSQIILNVTAKEGYRRSAFQKIREWGYEPADYKIEFIGQRDPFAS